MQAGAEWFDPGMDSSKGRVSMSLFDEGGYGRVRKLIAAAAAAAVIGGSMLGAVSAAGTEARWVPFGGSVRTPPLLIGAMAVSGA